MYPFAEQLLAYRRDDPKRRIGGLVLKVKGDFCYRVREILGKHGREDDYIELSLDCPYRYNPLYNDLEAYAFAYGIASLLTNLFGRGKEPFRQQAYTNVVKFIVLLTSRSTATSRSSTSMSAPSTRTFFRAASPRGKRSSSPASSCSSTARLPRSTGPEGLRL